MLLTEFDEEKDWAIIAKVYKEIGYKEGIEEGIKEGMKEGTKNLIKIMLSKGKTKEEILELIDISNEEYEKQIN